MMKLSRGQGPGLYQDKDRRFFSGLASIGHALRWFTAPPLLTIWYSLSKQSFTAIYIVIKDRREAQALYWTLTEGSACVLLPSRDNLMPVDKNQELITQKSLCNGFMIKLIKF